MAKSGMPDSDVDEGDGEKSELVVKCKIKESSSEKSYDSMSIINRNTKVSTPISILIESLVKNLCAVYEHDGSKAGLMYKLICEKLYQMNMIDKSYLMKEFEGIRTQYQYAFFQLLTASKGEQKPLSLQLWQDQNLATSHYHREFEEIDFIAGGGFGRVYKVKHKLDGTEYAIKKIPIRCEGLEHVKNYLSEVKTFASVNHPNIVQYKAAWLDMGSHQDGDFLGELDNDLILESISSSTHEYKEQSRLQNYIYHYEKSNSFSNRARDDSSDFEVVFEHSINNLESHRSNSNHFYKNVKSKREKRNSISEGGKAICPLDLKEIDEIRLQQKMHEKWAVLYIQMALCQSTLKQWLSQRNNSKVIDPANALVPVRVVQNSTVKEILKQLLEGLQYIHSKKIVHHDIKPSNIFIQTDNGKLLVQLGDFGLACPLQSVRHSLAFGTKLYAAPEQLAGECNPKSDMYSLGIVLFELVETFTTDMERNKCIEELKKSRYLPQRIVIQHPQFADIITKLVSKSPEERPSANELLQQISDASTASIQQIEELKCQLASKDEEIARLKELLKSAGVKSM
ncbi:hypothetical protein HHI36_005470 [Cryptolaemus montrouzieri]|uniref:non-specific serine/threonine protein kinase n=1 Tax=Cryptolaemus montrouzieri TaxID=559131 RepID=A0ABD2NV94_9CUCU